MRRIVLPLLALMLAGTSTFAVRTWLEGGDSRPRRWRSRLRSNARASW